MSDTQSDPRMGTGEVACHELQEMYELYALGVLEGSERAEVDEHISRGCETCLKALADAMSLNAAVLSFTPVEHPPAAVKHRVMAGIGHERIGWFWAGAFAAALMLIVALWLGVQERERTVQLATARRDILEITGERDHIAQALQFLSDPETKPIGFGRGQQAPPHGYVFLHPQLGVMLIASNLPPAGSGKAYEMWLIPRGGISPRPAGLFQSTGMRGLHILSGPVDITMINAVAVTVEPEAGSSAPTSTPMITAPVGS
jgi:anti-sigma-K factor RskA